MEPTSAPGDTPDFRRIFEGLPGCYLILKPDEPTFTIVAVSNDYLAATNTVREKILGRALFDVFPDNPNDATATGVANLTASLKRVLTYKAIDFMAMQKYDILNPDGNGFEERYWVPANSPILDESGAVVYIVHHVADVTDNEKLLQRYGGNVSHASEQGDEQLSQVERLNKVMIARELRMIELKKELAECKKQQKPL